MQRLNKIGKSLLVLMVVLLLSASCMFCTKTPAEPTTPKTPTLDYAIIFSAAKSSGYEGTLEDLVAAFKGDNAYKTAIEKGYIGSEDEWLSMLISSVITTIASAAVHEKTPQIGDNGNWWIAGIDTGVSAQGEKGEQGEQGEKGEQGLSAYDIFVKNNPDYLGDESQWINDMANGRLVRFTVTFNIDGVATVFTPFYGASVTDIPQIDQTAAFWDNDLLKLQSVESNLTYNAKYWKDGLTFELINDGTEYAVTGNTLNEMCDWRIPDFYQDRPVTQINKNAFRSCNFLTAITIGDNVKTIQGFAFVECYQLLSVDMKDSVTTIGELAFYSCIRLKEATLSKNLELIGWSAFADCFELLAIDIPSKVTSINMHTFSNCYALATVSLPDGITQIDQNAFFNCYKLAEITFGKSLVSIGENAFDGCESLSTVYFLRTAADNVTTVGLDAFSFCDSLLNILVVDEESAAAYKLQEGLQEHALKIKLIPAL